MAIVWPATVQAGMKRYEVTLLQAGINNVTGSTLAVDGDFGNGTKEKVKAYQTANDLTADGIVGPNTWTKIFASTMLHIIRFKIGNVIANDPTTTENDALYECKVTVDRIDATGVQPILTAQGAVLPDDMMERGRLVNGWYRLQLGFHKREGNPTAADLIVKTGSVALRPALIVNEDKMVPVLSDNPDKKESNSIHIHNGFNSERGSDGCPTIRPSQWSSFISLFLDKYTTLAEWHKDGTYRGRDIGVLIVE